MFSGAIVGFGEVARHGHWPAYQALDGVEIVAVVDRSASRRALAVELSPAIRTYGAIEDLLSDPDAHVDFVDICTPPALHRAPLVAAVRAGCHALCEKPFLLRSSDVDLVRDEAARAGVAVVPVHNWKHAPIVARATDALRGGSIGALRRVDIRVSRLRAAPTAEPGAANWRRDPALAGGGILMDHGWHALYLALHWFGQRATGVHALLHRPGPGAVEDEASVTVSFPDGEAVIALTWNGDARRNTITLTGTAGDILIADDTLGIGGAAPERFAEALSAGSHHEEWFARMLPGVVRCFESPQLAAPAFEEAAECLSIIERAYVV